MFRFLLILILSTSECAAMPKFLSGSVFERVGKETGVDPLLLYSISIVESGASSDGINMAPEPLVLRSSKGAEYFKSKEEAKLRLDEVTQIEKNVDIGLCQRNLKWHPHPTPEIFFDAEVCLKWQAEQIKLTLNSTDDLLLGIGRYHNWSDEIRASSYGERVLRVYQNLKTYE